MAVLIFDLDGTLTNSKKCILDSIRYAFASLNYGDVKFDEVSATQRDLATTFKFTLAKYKMAVRDEEVQAFIKHYRHFHQHQGEEHIQLYDSTADILNELRKDFRLAIATTKHSAEADRVVRKLGIRDFFEFVQGTDPGLRYKPAPDILLKTLKDLEWEATRSAYVGDSVHDMEAAEAGGLKQVGAAYGFGGSEPLTAHGPNWLIHSLTDLLSIRGEILESFETKTRGASTSV